MWGNFVSQSKKSFNALLQWKITDTSKHFTYFFSDASQNMIIINFKHILVVEPLPFSTSFILNHFSPV